MASDPQLSNLLKWGIENTASPSATNDTSPSDNATSTAPARTPNLEALAALFGGKSDADLMKDSMAALHSSIPLSEKMIAFDNLEQLIENIDNANNLGPMEMWTPLVAFLSDPEPEMRRMAAWCVGTAVQNNLRSQERALVCGAVPALVRMVREEEGQQRRKAAYAISSEVRNFQGAMDAVLKQLGVDEEVDASDMDKVDGLVERLREGKV